MKKSLKPNAKMGPQSDHKIDISVLRDPIFEVLGVFFRGLILYEFSIGKKSSKI